MTINGKIQNFALTEVQCAHHSMFHIAQEMIYSPPCNVHILRHAKVFILFFLVLVNEPGSSLHFI